MNENTSAALKPVSHVGSHSKKVGTLCRSLFNKESVNFLILLMYKLNEHRTETMQSISTSLIFANKCLSEFYASDTFQKNKIKK